jgi:hypothetical protein
MCAPSPTIIFIEHANGFSRWRLISTLIWLGSNISWTLIQIVMITFWAHHQQSLTCTRDNHICNLFKVPNPLIVWPVRFMYKRPCSEIVSNTSQHWYLAGRTGSWTHIKIISAEPRYIHILIPLLHDTSQAQGEIRATLVIARPFTQLDSLGSFHD